MALILRLHSFTNIRGTGDRVARATFRGVSLYSKVCENADETAVFDEVLEWPVARSIDSQEQIEIQLLTFNKYLSNRLIGTFCMVLQRLVDVGRLQGVSDCLLDDNNVVMQVTVNFDLSYDAPGGSTAVPWRNERFDEDAMQENRGSAGGLATEDDSRLLLPEKGSDSDSAASSPKLKIVNKLNSISRSSGIKSIRTLGKMMMLGRKRAASESCAYPEPVVSNDGNDDVTVGQELDANEGNREESSSGASQVQVPLKRYSCQQKWEYAAMKAQDFQVSVTVIEVRQLAGLNVNPVVCVQVGDVKKYTSVKESTSCPYYNEYFVFDFNMAPAMLFDKIIILSVLHSRNLLSSGIIVGVFKLDVGTVYAANDHQFYHRWAILSDPEDINSGPKGYLKCDIAVIGKGDNLKVPQKTNKDEDDIANNLLLPDGFPANRQKAKIFVRIYRAEGLPRMMMGLMANVKRALTGECKDLVDPYVVVSFAGHQAKTSVRKGTYEPVWNEQIIFTEMFPPLCRRIKIQLRDSDRVNSDVIGTHFIDLAKISNDGEKGFLPTFGPSWVNFYGSTRNFSLLEECSHLNEGLSEGVSFRGRLLVSIKTEILDDREMGPSMVEVEPTVPVADNSVGSTEDFFLFGCLMEANMIDRRLAEGTIRFELSIGNYGNALDCQNHPARSKSEPALEEEESLLTEYSQETLQSGDSQCNSITEPLMPQTRERYYYYLPIEDEKPCLWVRGQFEDYRRRLYNSNVIEKICEKLENGISEISEAIHRDRPNPEKLLRIVLDELAASCSRYSALCHTRPSTSSANRTKLDREHQQLCQQEIDQIGSMAKTLKAVVNKSNLREKLKSVTNMLLRLRLILHDPQDSLPDVFIWLIQNNKRIAYHRIQSKDIVFSIVDEEKGRDCAKVQTFYLKLPCKRGSQAASWTCQAQVQLYLWLGLAKHKKEMFRGLPVGYQETPEMQRACHAQGLPPLTIKYTELHSFQLRAHMYQARGLIGSDESGLSDPYARVIFSNASLCTQVIDETLNPTWDETLILNEISVYGTIENIKEQPPVIVVEIFDQDRMGKSEFIGRTVAKPVVKANHEKYEKPNFPPQLVWFDICRGSDRAGELLAAFELLQLASPGDNCVDDLPPFQVASSSEDKDRGPLIAVPPGIRPTLSKHRIEVLFWGVREMKRYQFLPVDKPRIDIECAGHILSSSVVQNMHRNPNFTVPVKYFDVDLPDNELYCPPITIRCVDCRNFGRFVLVGSHVIDNIHKFIYSPVNPRSTKDSNTQHTEKVEVCTQLSVLPQPATSQPTIQKDKSQTTTISTKCDDLTIVIDEEMPLISKPDPVVTVKMPIAKG